MEENIIFKRRKTQKRDEKRPFCDKKKETKRPKKKDDKKTQ